MKNNSLRHLLPVGLLALTALGTLPGCDVIKNPQPLKVGAAAAASARNDTLALDSAEAARPVPALVQRALLEKFTGQFCGNCPTGDRLISSSLRPQYGSRLTVLEVHAVDYFAAPKAYEPYLNDYRVAGVSQELATTFGISALPKGTVNRSLRGGTAVLETADWNTVIAQQLAQTPQQQLRLTPLYNPTTRRLRLKVGTRYLAAQPGRTFRLAVFISEDSLVSGQKDYNNPAGPGQQDIARYVHRDVLRAALLGTFGTAQAAGPAANSTAATYLTYQVPAAWQDRRCKLVAYLADAADRRIVQVSEVPLR